MHIHPTLSGFAQLLVKAINMTKLIFDKEKDRPNDEWTTERLVEELFLDLARAKEKMLEGEQPIAVSKYYRQAKEIMFLISVTRPTVPFIVNVSDFSTKVMQELEKLHRLGDIKTISYVLTSAVGKIFENVNFEYYHGSIMRNLKVRLV